MQSVMLPVREHMETLCSLKDDTGIPLACNIRRAVGSRDKWLGLETSNVITECVPMFLKPNVNKRRLQRIEPEKKRNDKKGTEI